MPIEKMLSWATRILFLISIEDRKDIRRDMAELVVRLFDGYPQMTSAEQTATFEVRLVRLEEAYK